MASTAAAVRRLDALFRDVKLSDGEDGAGTTAPPRRPSSAFLDAPVQVTVEVSADRNCDVHGGAGGRRGSLGNILRTRRNSVSPRRDSAPHTTYITRRRDSLGGLGSLSPLPKESLDHPSAFPTTLRRESTGGGVLAPPRDKRRFSTDSLEGRRNSWDPSRRGSSSSSGGWEDPLWEEQRSSALKVNIVMAGKGAFDSRAKHSGVVELHGAELYWS
ncbi:Arabinose import ATP-binding protein AraG [Frankliniella fusca]|uniref:Arabinose import ATP-binding protein AraG n=1 Tax=Frankliniella fusca TaxID=407009 RepID=A0AAE1H3J9_9NEOP|nr:Arabinose import ATP-binding protein AraG [Frankliniella fusca]